MRAAHGNWNDANCKNKYAFVCEFHGHGRVHHHHVTHKTTKHHKTTKSKCFHIRCYLVFFLSKTLIGERMHAFSRYDPKSKSLTEQSERMIVDLFEEGQK